MFVLLNNLYYIYSINQNRMKIITLTQNQITLVDDEDFDSLMQFKWRAVKNGKTFYVHSDIQIQGRRYTIKMHRLIMDTPKGYEVDHINHNGLDNRKSNLRNCTPSENRKNRLPWGSSKFVGVSKLCDDKFVARIKSNGKLYHIGTFKNEEDAAIAYNKRAIEIHGEFANINTI